MGRVILIDGYNIIKTTPALQAVEAQSLAAARQTLIAQLQVRYRHTPHQVIVVFDGDGEYEQVTREQRIRIMYSRYDTTADSLIARLAASERAAGCEVETYSNDWEVRQAVKEQGGAAYVSADLTSQLNAPTRDVARRAKHRIAMRKKYGLDTFNDPYHKDDDERAPDYPAGKRGKKKSPRRK